MRCVYVTVLSMILLVTGTAYGDIHRIDLPAGTRYMVLATHYLDRKEVYLLDSETIQELRDPDQDKAMPERRDIYDPEIYRGSR